jgi:hypothetical protein
VTFTGPHRRIRVEPIREAPPAPPEPTPPPDRERPAAPPAPERKPEKVPA